MPTVEERKDGGLSEACIKKELAGKAGMKRKRKKRKEKKGLAELLTNDRAIGPLLDYLNINPKWGGEKEERKRS